MKVRILGVGGMLGGMAERYFKSLDKYDVQAVSNKDYRADYRDPNDAKVLCVHGLTKGDHVINCIGAIKPKFNSIDQTLASIYVNAVFPRKLADECETAGVKLTHITTDCVFSGNSGKYSEFSNHDALDQYGKSKSLGEPENALVIRTSIIGPEWHGNKRSLVEWLLSKNGGKVDGYMNHMWNGLTTLELCKAIGQIIDKDMHQWDMFHLYSTDVSKYELLQKMVTAFDLNIQVNPVNAKESCDRTLRTCKQWQDVLKPLPLDDMLKEAAPFTSTL